MMRTKTSIASLALLVPLAACGGGDDPSPGANPTNISIAPSSSAPPSASTPASTPATGPSTAQSEGIQDATAAVAAAEAAVPDSVAVEVSKDDDDSAVVWEVLLRAGENGRELRISAADATVLSNKSDQLDESQLGEAPRVTAQEAIRVAEKRVPGGGVTEAELTRESGRRIWDLSVEVRGGDEWELWVDASSGKVVRQQRD